jgi:hypothetical protein
VEITPPILLRSRPVEPLKGRDDAVLVGSANAVRFETKCFFGDLPNQNPFPAIEPSCDCFFPNIDIEPLGLLRLDLLALEGVVRPPLLSGLVEKDSFGKKLVPVLGECVCVNHSDFDRPESPSAGFVAQICVFICCGNNTLNYGWWYRDGFSKGRPWDGEKSPEKIEAEFELAEDAYLRITVHFLLQALVCLKAKGVKLEQVTPSRVMNKIRESNGKPPKAVHSVVVIDPDRIAREHVRGDVRTHRQSCIGVAAIIAAPTIIDCRPVKLSRCPGP